MQAALKGLGALDTNERIRRFISTLPYEGDEQLDHDVDCVCPGCERQKVLGLRKSRRKEPSKARAAIADGLAPLSAHVDAERRLGRGSTGHPGKAYRRRPLDENARRGESKLGRVAHLRPGRITLGPERKPEAPQAQIEDAEDERAPLGPRNAALIDDASGHRVDRQVKGPSASRSIVAGERSWDSDEHSVHSNMVHREAKLVRTRRQDTSSPSADNASPSQPQTKTQRDMTASLYDDFYKRNPAALANGWLALPHHRNVPDVDSREQRREEAMTKLARELVRAAQTPIVRPRRV